MYRDDPTELLALPLLVSLRTPWPADWTADEVIRVLEPLAGERRRTRIEAVVKERLGSVTVLMDGPRDPHNASAVIRSCDAFGVQELHIVPRDEPFVAGKMVAKGTEHWVDVIHHEEPSSAAAALRARGFELVATHPEGELEPEELTEMPRIALIVGHEHDGIREELERAAAHRVRVPMRGFVESLNVSVAAALLLRAATRGRPGDLPEEDRRRLYARGLVRSVPRALDVLAASR
jgi:tRNA (guanosine-2'-O-)-methyltransferase